jgi:hypothetical protein
MVAFRPPETDDPTPGVHFDEVADGVRGPFSFSTVTLAG